MNENQEIVLDDQTLKEYFELSYKVSDFLSEMFSEEKKKLSSKDLDEMKEKFNSCDNDLLRAFAALKLKEEKDISYEAACEEIDGQDIEIKPQLEDDSLDVSDLGAACFKACDDFNSIIDRINDYYYEGSDEDILSLIGEGESLWGKVSVVYQKYLDKGRDDLAKANIDFAKRAAKNSYVGSDVHGDAVCKVGDAEYTIKKGSLIKDISTVVKAYVASKLPKKEEKIMPTERVVEGSKGLSDKVKAKVEGKKTDKEVMTSSVENGETTMLAKRPDPTTLDEVSGLLENMDLTDEQKLDIQFKWCAGITFADALNDVIDNPEQAMEDVAWLTDKANVISLDMPNFEEDEISENDIVDEVSYEQYGDSILGTDLDDSFGEESLMDGSDLSGLDVMVTDTPRVRK